MDKTADAVIEHFLGEEDISIERLDSENKSDFASYLLETDRVDVSPSTNQNMMVSVSRNTNMKTRRQRRADEQALESVDDDDSYFLVMDRTRHNPIVGHAMNIEEGRATEMRVEIFDEEYRSLRKSEGESLYDVLTALRMEAAEGTPYVCNISPKAQYKMENTGFEGGEFELLKWAPAFKNEADPGILMAYADGERKGAPSRLYVPETDEGFLADFVDDKLEAFYGENSTEISSEVSFEDYDDFGGLDLQFKGSSSGKSCYRVTGGGALGTQEVYERIREAREDTEELVEVRVDAEEADALKLSEKLLEERWLPTGYVPDIGGDYDAHELSYFFPNQGEEYSVTEEVADHFEEFGIPYRKKDTEHDLEEMKSVPVEVGIMPRGFSKGNALRYSSLWP